LTEASLPSTRWTEFAKRAAKRDAFSRTDEIGTYIDNSAGAIVNNGERHRCGEHISTVFLNRRSISSGEAVCEEALPSGIGLMA
jgi:hypothetical protein